MPSTDEKLSFVMRANPDQVAHLERLIQHTRQSARTKAVWVAIERYPDAVAELAEARQEIACLQDLLHRASVALDAADRATEERTTILSEIRSRGRERPHPAWDGEPR